MNKLKKWLLAGVITMLLPLAMLAQADNFDIQGKEADLFNRLGILLKHDSIIGFTTVKPFNRAAFTARVEYIDSLSKTANIPGLTTIDRYNMHRLLMDNSEWTHQNYDSLYARKPLWKHFYKTPAHLLAVDDKPLILRVDPVLYFLVGHSNDGVGTLYQNTRGVLIRGSIDNILGFYSSITDNQEKDPLYVQQWVQQHNALPGVGFYKPFKNTGYDYFNTRGGITFRAAHYIHFQFAYDKLFIGNGYRSLFLSDFSNNYLFMRINTQLWKLRYEMIVAETMQSVPQVDRDMKPKNYMAAHHLSAQLTRWLNVGLYENVMEDGKNGLQLSYLNPVIFYRATESNLGSAGKANVGIDAKAAITRNIQLYGQLLINEFHINEIEHYSRGNWVNKQAVQVGAKYINAFGIANLNLQGEVNVIRPFTYTNFDSVTNFTHYNQPLAHPLGANVRELIALANYQPAPRWYLFGKLDYFLQGLDSAGYNMGSNIFRSYVSRPRDNGFFIGTGIPVKCFTASINASWEVFENLFIDVTVTHRNYNIAGQPPSQALFYTTALRVNIARRTFDF